MGWSGWQAPNPATQTSLLDLRRFVRAGGARVVDRRLRTDPTRTRRVVQLTRQGRQMLRTSGAFAQLSPLFRGARGHRVYDIAAGGRPTRSAYVGTTAGLVGRRLLEHLLIPAATPMSRYLRGANDAALGRLQVFRGQFSGLPAQGGGKRQHMGEVILQQQLRPTWVDPSGLGFDV